MRTYDTLNVELETKFKPKKKDSVQLSKVYKRLSMKKKFETVSKCADKVIYDVYEDETTKLKHCFFCKDKLCPLCAWRKELKMFHDVSRVVEVIENENKYKFVFVTLTVKNIPNYGEELKKTIDLFNKAYSNLIRSKRLKGVIKGALRAIEVTYDGHEHITPYMYKKRKRYYKRVGLKVGDLNPNFDKLHPHMHLIWVVENDYYTSSDFLKQSELCEMWKDVLHIDYTPICDIRKIEPKNVYKDGKLVSYDLKGAVAEVSKYTVKSTDYLNNSDDLNEKVVKSLTVGLKNRKMVSYYGIIADIRRTLEFDKTEDDLIHVDDLGDTSEHGNVLFTISFAWSKKLGEYYNYHVTYNIDVQCDDQLETGRKYE